MDLSAELARRQTHTDKVLELLRAQPNTWLSWQAFAALVGVRAYRTRVSNARKVLEAEGDCVETRQVPAIAVERGADRLPSRMFVGPGDTQYRYLPQAPIGRDATVPDPAASGLLFSLHPNR